MGGICGVVDFRGELRISERKDTVAKMSSALLHRGSVAEAYFSDDVACLAMRSSGHIGLENGEQLISSTDGNYIIVFHGEIYNYKLIQESLLARGHHFKTNSSIEVVLHSFMEYGIKMLDKLRGMFSFCIYDKSEKFVFIARDSFGEKPLYYHLDLGVLSFSVEIKSLLQNNKVPRRINYTALPYYFRTSVVPEPITLLENIYTLEAGHYMIVNDTGIHKTRYFNSSYPEKATITKEEEAQKIVKLKLERSVERQATSNVPLSALLSGDINSSSVVAMLQKKSSEKIKTFQVKFEQLEDVEGEVARKVAEYCGTDHHEIIIPKINFTEDIFWTIIDHVGLPSRDSSAITTYLAAKQIPKDVDVVLSGDGADELFGGGELFQLYKKIISMRKLPAFIRSISEGGVNLVSKLPGTQHSSNLRRARRGIRTSLLAEKEIPVALNEFFTSAQSRKVFSQDKMPLFNSEDTYALFYSYPREYEEWSPLRKIMYYRLQHNLKADSLIKVDSMSMANSLEVRSPFLDLDLYKTSIMLSDDLLIQQSKGKYILREMMKKDLPKEVFDQPNKKVNIQLYEYQNSDYKALAKKLLFDENPWKDMFIESELRKIYEEAISNDEDNALTTVFQSSHKLWMLMQLLGWAIRFKIQA